MFKYYPVNLNLRNKKCVVVGAGSVAARKVRRLLECGAKVEIVAPKVIKSLERLFVAEKIVIKRRHVNLKDINDAFLVISATGNRRINNLVSRYCRENGILVNVVDFPDECNFTLPSCIRRGDLLITVSTSSTCPAFAKKIRKDLEKIFGNEYAKFLSLMKKLRPKVSVNINSPSDRKKFFEKAVNSRVIKLLKKGRGKQAKEALGRLLRATE